MSDRRLSREQRRGLARVLGTKWGRRETDYIRALQRETWFVQRLALLAKRGRRITKRF